MLKAIHERMARDEKGFTLIELMVVVLIIAILLAIAIPTFLRVRRDAQDRAAQSSVVDALKAEKAVYNGGAGTYTGDVAALEDAESSINYDGTTGDTCAAFVDEKCVRVTVSQTNIAGDTVLLVAQADSATFWAVKDVATNPGAGTFYNTGGSAAAPADATGAAW